MADTDSVPDMVDDGAADIVDDGEEVVVDEDVEDEDEDYPLDVSYCSVCTLPYEYCSFLPTSDACKAYVEKNEPEVYKELYENSGGDDGGGGKVRKRQTRGGKGNAKGGKKKGDDGPGKVVISLATRNKRKFVTNITGLGKLGINLKKAQKAFAGRFAASSSISGDDEIGVTGDHTGEIEQVILQKFPEVTPDMIVFKK